MDHRLNEKAKIIKHLEVNIREILCNLGVDKYSLDRTQKAQIIKEKNDKLNLKKNVKLLFEGHH